MKKVILFFTFLLLRCSVSFAQDDCNCWIPLLKEDTTFQIVPTTEGFSESDKGQFPDYYNDNGSTLPITLPFNFCFYNQSFNKVYINNNGNISFVKSIFDFAKGAYPLGTDTLMIAPFYADVDTWGGSKLPMGDKLYYKITPTCMIVKWYAVGFYDSPLSGTDNDALFNTFQLIITNGTDPILPAGSNVSFCYRDVFWAVSDTSGGFGGFDNDNPDARPAIVGVNKGNKTNYAQFGTFGKPGPQYNGPFAAGDGLYWLKNQSFTFNTCIDANIPPVIINAKQSCDTITVCALDTVKITASFLSPQKGQTGIVSASASGLSGTKILGINTVNAVSTVMIQLTPSASDTGVHVLNIIATDNSSPAQTSTSPMTVLVKSCALGIKEINASVNFSIYPNPGTGIFAIQIDLPQSAASNEAKIYDLLGNEIYSEKFNGIKTAIDLSANAKGLYFLKLYNKNMLIGIKKIVLE